MPTSEIPPPVKPSDLSERMKARRKTLQAQAATRPPQKGTRIISMDVFPENGSPFMDMEMTQAQKGPR